MSPKGVTKLDCGCKYDDRRWLVECAKHKAENDALHTRALFEHRFPGKTYSSVAEHAVAQEGHLT
jgi:hypothetical protein